MKETIFSALTGIGMGFVTVLLGGWDTALEILLVCMALDYLTGVAAAFKTKTLKSSTGYEGLVRKATIFLVVILAAQIDRLTGNPSGMFRSMTAMFFCANEALSVVENVGELGIPLPSFITKALMKLKDQNTDTDDEEGE